MRFLQKFRRKADDPADRNANADGKKPRKIWVTRRKKRKTHVVMARLPSRYVVDLPQDGKQGLCPFSVYGLIRFNVEEIQLLETRSRAEYFVTVSVGKQVWTSKDFRSGRTSSALKVGAGAEFVLQKGGATMARVAVFRRGALDGAWKNRLEGWCEVDLARTYFVEGDHGEDLAGRADRKDEGVHLLERSDDSPLVQGTFDLVDPEISSNVQGTIILSGRVSSLADLERQVWQQLLALADFDGNGSLSEPEFKLLLRAFGATLSDEELTDLFNIADTDGSGHVSLEELASFLAFCDHHDDTDMDTSGHGRRLQQEDGGSFQRECFDDDNSNHDAQMMSPTTDEAIATNQENLRQGFEDVTLLEECGGKRKMNFSDLMRRCPIDGAALSPDPSLQASNLIYVWLALAATRQTHEADLRAGYYSEAQAAASWMLRLSEWASQPISSRSKRSGKYQVGLNVGDGAHHILVYDRAGQRIVEELINPVLTIAMRNLYQSKMGRTLMRQGLKKKLVMMSVKEGSYRSSPESVRDIKPFVESFRGQIDIEESEKPLDKFDSFNDFFTRRLKRGARPIAHPDDDDVIVSAADCRLLTFESVDDATRFWVKGRNFSIPGLLGDSSEDHAIARQYLKGTMAIFRLAPQDYHRFHSPVKGTIESISQIPGDLLTVNPIAVNSMFHDVFTVNKRDVCVIRSSAGPVAFVAIGATLVGSIVWSVQPGDLVQKGNELGYFEFGGSTCIVLFPESQPVVWDGDLRSNAKRSLETLIKMGERIGARSNAHFTPRASEGNMIDAAHKAASGIKLPSRHGAAMQRLLSGQSPEGISSAMDYAMVADDS